MRRALQRHLKLAHLGPRWRAAAGCAGLLALAVAIAGCGLSTARANGRIPVQGGTASYALPPNQQPVYIFPFDSSSYFSVVNTDYFQYLMYRPLYWFGASGLPYLNPSLSLASQPAYRGQTVTIKLKPYRWSDGEQLTADDVVFWMHMMQAVAASDWGGYVPGGFPDNVASVKAVGQDEVQMVIKGVFSHQWFTYNELSQITPMPLAWDRTAHGKSDCVANVSDCAAVYSYLNSIAQSPATWARSRIWRVVDGPWRLASYTSQGVITFDYNPDYSGPAGKYHISVFQERPFTSEEAEFNVLEAGGSDGLDVGYMPTVDAPVPPPDAAVGQNPPGLSGYRLTALYVWGLSYFPYNFGPADPQRAVIGQLYVRKALQLLENQAAIIQGPLHGYGQVTTGVVGGYPTVAKYLSPLALKGDPYPYDPAQATALLTGHGWKLVGGVMTCTDPGSGPTQCGAGIHAGTKLDLTMYYATGSAWLESAVLQLKSNAEQIGIAITLIPRAFQDVINEVTGVACGAPGCPWELADWGLGWSYSPDYLPTGDELFLSHAAANFGQYLNPTNDGLIQATLRTSSSRAMWKWENYLTGQLPVGLQPNSVTQLIETVDTLRIGKQSPTLSINPEQWYFVR